MLWSLQYFSIFNGKSTSKRVGAEISNPKPKKKKSDRWVDLIILYIEKKCICVNEHINKIPYAAVGSFWRAVRISSASNQKQLKCGVLHTLKSLSKINCIPLFRPTLIDLIDWFYTKQYSKHGYVCMDTSTDRVGMPQFNEQREFVYSIFLFVLSTSIHRSTHLPTPNCIL